MARELKEEGIGNKVLYCPPAHAQPVVELEQSRTEQVSFQFSGGTLHTTLGIGRVITSDGGYGAQQGPEHSVADTQAGRQWLWECVLATRRTRPWWRDLP